MTILVYIYPLFLSFSIKKFRWKRAMRRLPDGEQQVHDVTVVSGRDVTIATVTTRLRVGGVVGVDSLQRKLRHGSEDKAEERLFAPGCRCVAPLSGGNIRKII